MKLSNKTETINKPYGCYEERESAGFKYKSGVYYHPKGIVSVYASAFKTNFIMFSFIYNGTKYERKITGSKSISDKAINTRANQFVKSLFIK